MGKFLNLDSPLMRFLSRMTDVLWLNILTILCCLPIITAGASFTAMHYVCLKMVRGEEGYISRDFFKSFRENFKQATGIWAIYLLFIFVVLIDYRIVTTDDSTTVPIWVFAGILVALIFAVFTLMFVFPVLSHFSNTVKGTLRNSFVMSIMAFPKTILMIILYLLPWVLFELVYQIIPLCVLFCFAGPAYVSALLYNTTFKKYEPEKEPEKDDFSWNVAENGENGSEDSALEDTEKAITGETSVTDEVTGTENMAYDETSSENTGDTENTDNAENTDNTENTGSTEE